MMKYRITQVVNVPLSCGFRRSEKKVILREDGWSAIWR